MKYTLWALGLLLCGCATVTTIGIDPGEQFVLGGGQTDGFEARLENQGTDPVRIAEITATGDTLAVAELAPGETTTARFSAGSAALLINRGSQEALVRGRIRAGSSLQMRYTPVED